MKYFSLNQHSPKVNFAEATLRGQAPDKGLYFPEKVPALPKGFITALPKLAKEEIGVTVMKPYVGDCIPEAELKEIIQETVNFNIPLIPITSNISSLELFHGPTLAFKDVGARFMSRCLGYFNRHAYHKTTILVATSGDTGGAVANGFLGVDGVDVIILYPSGKVSKIQELQLTSLGQNITALEIKGTFDDCQSIVKQAFMDPDLTQRINLTSANSINVARWLPQQLYYFFALQQWKEKEPPVIAVPSGNFGNICAGILAHLSGLPVRYFLAACNANDVVPRFLESGEYVAKPSVATLSNAMDVGNPSNFVRILEMFDQQVDKLKLHIGSSSVDDATTLQTIREVEQLYNYTLDPHGAVAFYALQQYLDQHPGDKGFITETAHPIKFPDTVESATGKKPFFPEQLKDLLLAEKRSILMQPNFSDFKEWLMHR